MHSPLPLWLVAILVILLSLLQQGNTVPVSSEIQSNHGILR